MRKFLFPIIALAVAFQLPAQEMKDEKDPDIKVTGSGKLPSGWHLRLDRAKSSAMDLKFTQKDEVFHVNTGPAAIFFNPEHVAKNEFSLEASFHQTKASRHPEAYGLFFAGSNLQKDDQAYVYFLVRQDGKYLIKRRTGSETSNIVGWTGHSAVMAIDDDGKATNKLAVMVGKESVDFMANGKKVHSLSRSDIGKTEGQTGLRVNHNLDVEIEGFALSKAK